MCQCLEQIVARVSCEAAVRQLCYVLLSSALHYSFAFLLTVLAFGQYLSASSSNLIKTVKVPVEVQKKGKM